MADSQRAVSPRIVKECTIKLLDDECRPLNAARAATRRTLAAWGVDSESVCEAELIVSELVTNAYVHGQDPDLTLVLVAVAAAGVVRIEVHDTAPVTPALRNALSASLTDPPRPDADGGRGMAIVRSLTKENVELLQDGHVGKTIRANLPVALPALPCQPDAPARFYAAHKSDARPIGGRRSGAGSGLPS